MNPVPVVSQPRNTSLELPHILDLAPDRGYKRRGGPRVCKHFGTHDGSVDSKIPRTCSSSVCSVAEAVDEHGLEHGRDHGVVELLDVKLDVIGEGNVDALSV